MLDMLVMAANHSVLLHDAVIDKKPVFPSQEPSTGNRNGMILSYGSRQASPALAIPKGDDATKVGLDSDVQCSN